VAIIQPRDDLLGICLVEPFSIREISRSDVGLIKDSPSLLIFRVHEARSREMDRIEVGSVEMSPHISA
jgi:hypothetical protein